MKNARDVPRTARTQLVGDTGKVINRSAIIAAGSRNRFVLVALPVMIYSDVASGDLFKWPTNRLFAEW